MDDFFSVQGANRNLLLKIDLKNRYSFFSAPYEVCHKIQILLLKT